MKSIKEYILENSPNRITINNKSYYVTSEFAIPFCIYVQSEKLYFGKKSTCHYKNLKYKFLDILDFIKKFLGKTEKFYTGRVWCIPNENIDQKYDIYICWWNELSSEEFNRLNKKIIKKLSKKYNIDLTEAVIIDNNGKLINFNINNNEIKEIEARTEENKIKISKIKQIHLASQEDKEEFFKEFKKLRDEYNQQKYYNHTKSKTEAEWRSIKYQESLEE